MGGGSSSAKKTSPTVTPDEPKDPKAAKQPDESNMNREEPNKNKQTPAKKEPAKPADNDKSGRRQQNDDDPAGDEEDASREPRDRYSRRNGKKSGGGQNDRRRGSTTDEDDDDDDRSLDERRRRGERANRNKSHEQKPKSRAPERDQAKLQEEERERYLKNLRDISDELYDKPPDPVNDSKTYTSAVETYENRLQLATNERELKSLYDRELKLLQSQTAEDHLRANHAKHNNATRQTQESEYRLKLSALINCFKEKNRHYELLTLQREKEKREDMAFLKTLRDQIKTDDLSRDDALRQMDEYSRYHRRSRQENSANDRRLNTPPERRHGYTQHRDDDPSDRYTTRPAPGPGVQHRQSFDPQYGTARGYGHTMPAGAKLRVKDEAAKVLAESERNTQRVVDVRKADRDRINRDLSSRATSINSPPAAAPTK